jgi:hypothetical protein
LAPTSETLAGVVYTEGLVALDEPNVLLAASGNALLRSNDAGCHFAEVATLPWTLMQLTPARGARAYGFHPSYTGLVRIEGDTVVELAGPGGELHGLGVDNSDGLHLRVVDDGAQVHESFDGGESWSPVGLPADTSDMTNTAAFDPHDLDRVVVGRGLAFGQSGVTYTHDGGATWQDGAGVGAADACAVFAAQFSPMSGDVVWVMGLESDYAAGTFVRWIWRSVDGGASFDPVVQELGDVDMNNGTPLFPHPVDTDVVYFTFGVPGSTDLYRYDFGSGAVSATHNGYDQMDALVFSPANPSLLYLAITSEDY